MTLDKTITSMAARLVTIRILDDTLRARRNLGGARHNG
jgi:hypothetical protein